MSKEIRDLIRDMSSANVLWGAPRLHGERLKLGIDVSQATVAKYMLQHRATILLGSFSINLEDAHRRVTLLIFFFQRFLLAVHNPDKRLCLAGPP